MNKKHSIFNVAVIVAALGYFVDVYDLVLFSMVRIPSLRDFGLPKDQILNVGMNLHNWQMIGMLLPIFGQLLLGMNFEKMV